MREFRDAVEARDHTAIAALLADDVVFTSPVAFAPYRGKAVTAAILRAVMWVFEDFRHVRAVGRHRAGRRDGRAVPAHPGRGRRRPRVSYFDVAGSSAAPAPV